MGDSPFPQTQTVNPTEHYVNDELKDLKKNTIGLASQAKQASELIQLWGYVIQTLYLVLLRIYVIVPTLLLYRRTGSRYLSLPTLVFGLVSLWFMAASSELPGIGPTPFWLQVPMLLGVIGVYVVRVVQARLRDRRGDVVHTMSQGVPYLWDLIRLLEIDWLERHVTQWTIEKWLLPAILVLAGLWVQVTIGVALGPYLIVSGVAMWLRCVVLESRERRKLLDALDQQIEAEWFEATLENRETKAKRDIGWTVPIRSPFGND